MSRVLISFLGTSIPGNREYRKADYKFNNNEVISSSFISDAIKQYYDVEKLILVGTVKSMWEEVYRTFSKELIDEDYYIKLSDFCKNANFNSKLELPEVDKIENVLGRGSKVVLIKYGLNDHEISLNQELIMGIDKYLNKNDELIVDITHSFRSLPLFLLNTLIYIQNVSPKNIVIDKILYGMLDITTELGYTPVVNLKSIMNTHEWIVGAYSFKEFGNAYKIAELLKDVDKSSYTKLKRFSDAKNLNYFDALEKQVQELQSFRGEGKLPTIAQKIVNPVVEEFIKKMSSTKNHFRFQYELAQWHYNKMNYMSSYICLTESIISFACIVLGLNENDKDDRDEAKNQIHTNYRFSNLRSMYTKINNVRKQLAHNVVGDKSIDSMIQNLRDGLANFGNIINES